MQHGQNDQGKKIIKSGNRGPRQWKNMVGHVKSEENMLKMTTKYCRTKRGFNSLNISRTDLNMCHMVAEVLKHLIALWNNLKSERNMVKMQGKKNIKSGIRGPKQWKNMVRHVKSEENLKSECNMVKMTKVRKRKKVVAEGQDSEKTWSDT